MGARGALVALALLSGCDTTTTPAAPPPTTPCGQGPIALSLGAGRPFRPEPAAGGALQVEYGLQGGYHTDITLRLTGALDPDLVDVELTLIPLARNPHHIYGAHSTTGWYLLYPSDAEPPGCYFYSARVFLFTAPGVPPREEEAATLDGQPAALTLTLRHRDGVFSQTLTRPLAWRAP